MKYPTKSSAYHINVSQLDPYLIAAAANQQIYSLISLTAGQMNTNTKFWGIIGRPIFKGKTINFQCSKSKRSNSTLYPSGIISRQILLFPVIEYKFFVLQKQVNNKK